MTPREKRNYTLSRQRLAALVNDMEEYHAWGDRLDDFYPVCNRPPVQEPADSTSCATCGEFHEPDDWAEVVS